MIYKNLDIPIHVKQVRTETPGTITIIFDRPRNFDFSAGDWIDIGFGKEEIKGGVTYSISSSPTEPDLMITFREGVSEVKQALMAAQVGSSFSIVQYGNDYDFRLREHARATFIAGGIGIAPFRSMIKEMVDTNGSGAVNLLYFNNSGEFVFKRELDLWQMSAPNLTIQYVETRTVKKKDRLKMLSSAAELSQNAFYIAGPEAMVELTEHTLLDCGVKLKNIKIDSFGGY